jgi:zinc protease
VASKRCSPRPAASTSFGFTATELEREKQDLLRAVERAYAERERTASASFVGDYVEHFLTGEPYPSLATQWALTRQLVPTITLAEVNQVARAAIGERNRVLAVSAPAKPGVPTPTADTLRAALARAAAAPVTAYADEVSDAPLVAQLPPAGRVTSARTHADVGVTEWTLSNGVRVLLKPTDFKADEVRFTAFSPGGASLVSDSAAPSASLASIIVQQGGLGSFPRVELQKKLAGKAASAAPYLSLYSEGLAGQASPRDLETLFQLIHLTVTAPRADTAAFQALKAQIGAFVANRGASPEQVFGDTIAVTMAQHHARARPITPAYVNEVDLGTALRVYRERFADAGDFTFVFVGSFSADSVRPLVERYLATLPATGRRESPRDLGLRPPTGVVERTVRKGVEPKAETRLVFTGALANPSRERRFALSMLGEVLELRLRDRLREALGGTYGVQVSAGAQRVPRDEYSVSISFGSAPERADELTRAVYAELDSLRARGATADEIAKVRELQTRERETSLKQNAFWLGQLAARAEHGEPLADILTYDRVLATLTPELVRDAARAFLDPRTWRASPAARVAAGATSKP